VSGRTDTVRAPSASQGRGLALVAACYVIWGSIGALVYWATAPESLLLVLRFGIASLVLTALLARRKTFAEYRRPGMAKRILLMGVLDSGALICFFVALREAGVAAGMFLFFTGPVFVAVLAPRLTRQPTDRVVWPALCLAMAGLGAILMPGITGGALHFSLLGAAFGVAGAVIWAFFMMVMKSLTRTTSSGALVLAECWLDCLFMVPLAVWQTVGSGYSLTANDWISGALLGVVNTALVYWLFLVGMRQIRVQHASILGYLEPVTAPLWALLLLGEVPSVWTLAGGALIVVAGVLVVWFGRPEEAAEMIT
jgi:drug/metabolite transporter (DMT)-like permease